MRYRFAIALMALLVFVGGAWWWLGRESESAVESSVKQRLSAHADSVSCTEDHKIRTGEERWVVYRCFPSGGTMDGVETCVIWNGTRLVGGREVDRAGVGLTDTFCEGQG
jgi:hypothetical protein